MGAKELLIYGILEREWKMFQAVPNAGGKAPCQEDFDTFRIMRSSQAAGWSEAALESYLDDLTEAESAGRNLLTEKYARMMQSTWPAEYAHIEHLLPPVSPGAADLINQIVGVVLKWEKELLEKYPYVLQKGRPLSSEEDSPGITSLETYLRGELATYSVRTLGLYLAHIMEQQSEGTNGSAITLAHTMKHYGFDSLEEANDKLEARS
ncbi:MAG: DUF4125 family protein [Dehalococcoidia bacterium]|nr:DUF4125 family protein [Dehalococcoidia bacterium]